MSFSYAAGLRYHQALLLIYFSGYPFRSAQLKVRIKGQAKDYTIAMKRKSEGLRHVY